MAAKRGFDPFGCIPTSKAIRKRLEEVQEQARRLRILLQTAEGIEQQGRSNGRERGREHDRSDGREA